MQVMGELCTCHQDHAKQPVAVAGSNRRLQAQMDVEG